MPADHAPADQHSGVNPSKSVADSLRRVGLWRQMETTSLTLRIPARIKAALIRAAAKAKPQISANKLAAHLIEEALRKGAK